MTLTATDTLPADALLRSGIQISDSDYAQDAFEHWLMTSLNCAPKTFRAVEYNPGSQTLRLPDGLVDRDVVLGFAKVIELHGPRYHLVLMLSSNGAPATVMLIDPRKKTN